MIIMAQFVLLFLVALAVVLVIQKYRQRKIGVGGLFLWLVLWFGGGSVILFPGTSIILARLLGIGRGADLVLYLSVIFILYLVFRIYVRLERLDREMTQVVREMALRGAGIDAPKDEQE